MVANINTNNISQSIQAIQADKHYMQELEDKYQKLSRKTRISKLVEIKARYTAIKRLTKSTSFKDDIIQDEVFSVCVPKGLKTKKALVLKHLDMDKNGRVDLYEGFTMPSIFFENMDKFLAENPQSGLGNALITFNKKYEWEFQGYIDSIFK